MNDNNDLINLENKVLTIIFQGDDPVLSVLREQYSNATVKNREITGAGVFTYFSIPDDVKRITGTPSFKFGDVKAQISNLKNGAGFLVFIEDGKLASLETYSYEEPWPDTIGDFEVSYISGKTRDLKKVSEAWSSLKV